MPVIPVDPRHRVIAADRHAVPKPFRSFAVRSEEPRHAEFARAPYGWVHVIQTEFLDGAALASLAEFGRQRMQVSAFSDIDYAQVTLAEIAAAASSNVASLVGQIAAALQATGVLGAEADAGRHSVAARIDYLGSQGAGFHNDVSGHWTGCLFWNLALCVADVEFVMPHAGVRHALAPGDLVVFDQTMAHGLCRPRDQGQAVAASFELSDSSCQQIFLAGELPLTDAQWAALGSPWRPVEEHQREGALDLLAAEFDDRSGAIKSLRALKNRMAPGADFV